MGILIGNFNDDFKIGFFKRGLKYGDFALGFLKGILRGIMYGDFL